MLTLQYILENVDSVKASITSKQITGITKKNVDRIVELAWEIHSIKSDIDALVLMPQNDYVQNEITTGNDKLKLLQEELDGLFIAVKVIEIF